MNSTKHQLPSGWRWVRLEEVCGLVNGDAYKESDWNISGMPIIRIQNLNDFDKPFNYWNGGLDDRVCINSGDLLLAWSGTPGTSFGAHIWERGQGVLNQHIFRVDIDSSILSSRWAMYAINQRLEILINKAHGGVGLRHVIRKEVDTLEIPLPPLDEQKRLVLKLNELMKAVQKARTAAEAQLEAAKALPAAYLRQVFPKSGEELPSGWRWVKLREVCECIEYGYTASADFTIHEPKFLRITDIQNGVVDWESVPGCNISVGEETSKRLKSGDIVFARTGGTTGKSYLIKAPPRAVFASYLIRMSPSTLTIPDYLYDFFQSDDYWQQIKVNARGGAQPNVNATLLSKLILPLPSLPEQKRIAAELSEQMIEAEKLRASLEAQLSEINALPAALLRQAFNGEL